MDTVAQPEHSRLDVYHDGPASATAFDPEPALEIVVPWNPDQFANLLRLPLLPRGTVGEWGDDAPDFRLKWLKDDGEHDHLELFDRVSSLGEFRFLPFWMGSEQWFVTVHRPVGSTGTVLAEIIDWLRGAFPASALETATPAPTAKRTKQPKRGRPRLEEETDSDSGWRETARDAIDLKRRQPALRWEDIAKRKGVSEATLRTYRQRYHALPPD